MHARAVDVTSRNNATVSHSLSTGTNQCDARRAAKLSIKYKFCIIITQRKRSSMWTYGSCSLCDRIYICTVSSVAFCWYVFDRVVSCWSVFVTIMQAAIMLQQCNLCLYIVVSFCMLVFGCDNGNPSWVVKSFFCSDPCRKYQLFLSLISRNYVKKLIMFLLLTITINSHIISNTICPAGLLVQTSVI